MSVLPNLAFNRTRRQAASVSARPVATHRGLMIARHATTCLSLALAATVAVGRGYCLVSAGRGGLVNLIVRAQ